MMGMENLPHPPTGIPSPDRPARLHRLRYPSHPLTYVVRTTYTEFQLAQIWTRAGPSRNVTVD